MELWIKIDTNLKEEDKKRIISEALKLSKVLVTEAKDFEVAKLFGSSRIVSSHPKSDILLVKNISDLKKAKKEEREVCIDITVKSKGDERKIIEAAKESADYAAVKFLNWRVIPLENLIAEVHGKCKLIAYAENAEEAKLAIETLELGADGILAETNDMDEIRRIYEVLREEEFHAKIKLQHAEITGIKPLGTGARACIDTCDLMNEGEGLLVGCQSSGFFLVEAEVHKTPFVAPRPFRVNAGSVALYVLASEGKTRYISELKTGEEVLIVDKSGRSRTVNICRVKIEWRPLILIEAHCEGKKVKTILQNAETIRLVTEDGSISVKDLKKGDEVLVHLEKGGRHFGVLVEEERIIEV